MEKIDINELEDAISNNIKNVINEIYEKELLNYENIQYDDEMKERINRIMCVIANSISMASYENFSNYSKKFSIFYSEFILNSL